MPTRAPSVCRKPGCPGMVTSGVCSQCGPTAAASKAAHDATRDTAAQRGYGGRWQRIRAMYLRINPLCVECQKFGVTTAATDVHHIVPKREGGSDAASNLQALCHACHSRITGQGG